MKTWNQISKYLFISIIFIYIIFIFLPRDFSPFLNHDTLMSTFISIYNRASSPTTLDHLAFGLFGSEESWHHRKAYIESWWRPNVTHGFIYLDKPPTGDLIPWSNTSPVYRVSDNLTDFLQEIKAAVPVAMRAAHAIMEVFREMDHENLRWVVMGDDDSLFFVDNLVEVLARYDHTKYYYFGGVSEFIMSNHWFSFNMGYGGAGFILSYPLAKALAADMENCLRRNPYVNVGDMIAAVCIADIGVTLSPLKGLHQIDMHGDISGLLSSHPASPLLSLHHLDHVEPFFPNMDRANSTRHLMKAVAADQSRMLQQTICHHKQNRWSFSIAWGYSAHIYERIMPRFHLQKPIETFQIWVGEPRPRPQYMFNTREPSKDPCEAPHVFFLREVQNSPIGILTIYNRAAPRGLPDCGVTAENVSAIHVLSPATKRLEMDRAECCDVVMDEGNGHAYVGLRECLHNETIV